MDAAFAVPRLVRDPGLADRRPDRVGHQLLVALEPVAPVVDQRDILAVVVEQSALTPEKVPTPPAAAQAPRSIGRC